jgi:hypothetical protein
MPWPLSWWSLLRVIPLAVATTRGWLAKHGGLPLSCPASSFRCAHRLSVATEQGADWEHWWQPVREALRRWPHTRLAAAAGAGAAASPWGSMLTPEHCSRWFCPLGAVHCAVTVRLDGHQCACMPCTAVSCIGPCIGWATWSRGLVYSKPLDMVVWVLHHDVLACALYDTVTV